MSVLRILLVAALAVAAKASIADRVVPEEQFYDQAAEQKFSGEQTEQDATRSARVGKEEGRLGSIGALLDTLLNNIATEQTECDRTYTTDSTTCTDTQKGAKDVCEKTHVDALKILTDDAEQKRSICTQKTTIHEAKKKTMDTEQAYNTMITAQRDQSVDSLTDLTTHAQGELKSCTSNADGNLKRVQGYINNAYIVNTESLDAADKMVNSIEKMVKDLQSKTGSGTGSRFETEAPGANTNLLQRMPMAQRTQLKMLQIKYVAGDRTLDQADDFAKVFTDIRKSIQDQRVAVKSNQGSDLLKVQGEHGTESARCNTEQARTIKAITESHDELTSQTSASDVRLNAAQEAELTAREIMDTTCGQADTAEELLATQTPILQANHEECDQVADGAYTNCQDAADKEEATCATYLETERATVEKIQAINAGLGTQQVAGTALLQAASRFIRHVAKRNSNGKVQMPMLYTTDLSKYGSTKDKIIGLVGDMKKTAAADKITEDSRASKLHTDNVNKRDQLKKDAEAALTKITNDQAALVLAAAKVRDEKFKIKGDKDAAFGQADAACTLASETHGTAVETQMREVGVCTSTNTEALEAAQTAFTENMKLATSKKTTSLGYLTDERATVAELRAALSSLGSTTECATDLLQKGTLTAEQTQAIVSLLTLSGQSQYDATARAGYTAGQHSQTCRIEELLKSIEADITKEEETANANFGLDEADINKDKADAIATANGILAACEKKYQDIVDAAEGDMKTKCDVLLPAALAAQTLAQSEYDAALKAHGEAVQTEKETVRVGTEERDNALTDADNNFDERQKTINNDQSAEIARLNATIADCDSILNLVKTMNFTAQELLQAKAKGVDNGSYRTASSADSKTKIIDLIKSLQSQVGAERARSAQEFLSDNEQNNIEKQRADDECASVAKTDIDSLESAVQTARFEKTEAEPVLAEATRVHNEASQTHNANLDTTATARAIIETNTPNFDKDLAETKQVAAEILKKQQELHLKCTLSTKYLEITKGYVTLIQTAASSVSTSALDTTVNTAVSVEDAYTKAKTADMIASAHESIKDQLAKDTAEERSRARLQGVDNPNGDHEDEKDIVAWDHDTHTNVANHALTKGMGDNQKYDNNGDAVKGRRLLATQTLGSVIDAILSQIAQEQARVKATCDSQEQEFTGQHVDTLKVAQDHYDAQKLEDSQRLSEAELAEASSFGTLQDASSAKINAQNDYDEKAATLRDALATQAKWVPEINTQKEECLASNTKLHTSAEKTIVTSKTNADAKYTEQEDLLGKVELQIKDGVDKAVLLQSLATAVKQIVKTRLYAFTRGSAKHFEDKSAGDYHNDFDAAKYNGETDSLTGLIDGLIKQNNDQLEIVKSISAKDITAEETKRGKAITAADAALQDELDRLQKDVDSAKTALTNAQAAEKAQKTVMDNAVADRVLKESNHASTVQKANDMKTAANEKRQTCTQNAESAHTTELETYSSVLSTAQEVLQYEKGVITQMRAAMNGDNSAFSASPEMQTFNHCTDEKAASVAAATKCTDDKNACEHSKIASLDTGASPTRRLLTASDPCADETTSCAKKGTLRAAYEECTEPTAELLSTEELKAAFVQLHSKYASETAMTNSFGEHKVEMDRILNQVEEKINGEIVSAQSQHDEDAASSLSKKNADILACFAAEKAVIDKWDGKVSVAKDAWDAAARVEAKEVAEFGRLEDITNAKQLLHNAAVNRQTTEGATARTVHKGAVDKAWEVYTTSHGQITSVASSDYEFLTSELTSLQTIKDIVNQLNLDGDLNGDYTSEAITNNSNDYTTTAATQQATYHGDDITPTPTPTPPPMY